MRLELILIAAIGRKGEMGLQGQLPWSHPEDLNFFKQTTANSPLIMGRKTFESLPRLLKNRTHLILSSQGTPENPQVIFCSDFEAIKAWLAKHDCKKAFVIGGRQIYDLLAPYCSKCFITHFDHSFLADTFFPLEVLKNRPILSRTPLVGESLKEYTATIVEYGA